MGPQREGERISGGGSTEPPKSGGAGSAGAGAGRGEGALGVTLLADTEHFGAVEVRSEPGGIAPPLHLHARHAECFFVLEGELAFRLEDRELVAGADTWVVIPQDVVHTFSVTGDVPARFLDIHTPSCGFGAFVHGLQAATSEEELRDVRAAFDQQPAPEYATGDPGLVVVRRSGGDDGEAIGDRSDRRRATLLVDTDELTVTEFFYGPGERGAQPHVHHLHSDAFLVLEGELTFSMREPLRGPAGTLVLFPPNVVHGFDNDGAESALFYNFHMPATGFGEYLRGRNPDFDQHDPPAGGGADPASAVTVRLSGG
jgi:quercetin dioxygenase-like cupin family protein